MTITIQNKIKEFRDRFIKNPWNVVEVGEYDMDGYARELFKDANDFCRVDCRRHVEIDIVADCHEIHRLFDYNPDVVLCLNALNFDRRPQTTIKSVKKLLMPGGFLIIATPIINGGSFADAFFYEYEVLDMCELLFDGKRTICGIARKPYTIQYDTKSDS